MSLVWGTDGGTRLADSLQESLGKFGLVRRCACQIGGKELSHTRKSITNKQAVKDRTREDSRGPISSRHLMTPQECAAFLQIEVNTLYVMKSQGRIPCRKVGHLLRFDFDEIIEWTKGSKSDCDVAMSHVPSGYLCGCNRRNGGDVL